MNLFAKTKLFELAGKVNRLSEASIFVDVVSDRKVQEFIVKLNTDQMRVDFMNSDGVPLADIGGEYSPFTVQTGNKKGRDKVDLYDTGEFHKSFRIQNIRATGFEITSDPVKEDGTNLLVEWGKEIEGLTFENLEKASTFMAEFYRQKIREALALG